MNMIERFQIVLILLGVGLGVLLGKVSWIHLNAGNFILFFILLMLYSLFVTIPFNEIKKSFKNLKFTGTTLIINFVWTPLFAWLLGAIFLRDHPELWIGLIMLMVTPCTDWYLVFTGLAKGNVALATSILPVNLILQILLLPVYLFLFTGVLGTLQVSVLIESILLVLLVPFVLAILTRWFLTKIKNKDVIKKKVISFMGNAQIIFLCLVIVAMFASQGDYLLNNINVLLLLSLPILIFYVLTFILGEGMGRYLSFRYEDRVSVSMTILARNSPTSLAIALIAFPDQPLIALALVIGPLIELPLLAVVTQIFLLSKTGIGQLSKSESK